jgi:hypothetical protein
MKTLIKLVLLPALFLAGFSMVEAFHQHYTEALIALDSGIVCIIVYNLILEEK